MAARVAAVPVVEGLPSAYLGTLSVAVVTAIPESVSAGLPAASPAPVPPVVPPVAFAEKQVRPAAGRLLLRNPERRPVGTIGGRLFAGHTARFRFPAAVRSPLG